MSEVILEILADFPVNGFTAVEAERRDGVRHLLRGQLVRATAIAARPLQGGDEGDDGARVAEGRPEPKDY